MNLRTRFVSMLIVVATIIPSYTSADLLDYFAGDTINHSIVRIDSALNQFADKLDDKGEKYLARFESLVSEVMKEGQAVLQTTRLEVRDDLFELESRIFDDITGALWEAECTAVRLAEGTFQTALVSAVDRVIDKNPTLTASIFGFDIAKIHASQEPDVAPHTATRYYLL